MAVVLPVIYIVLLVTAGLAVRPPARGFPVATVAASVIVAGFSLPQLTFAPGLYDALRRDRAAIGDGEVWRLFTSFVVQDSGWTGTIFNLLTLAVIGTLAERLWGTRRWLLIAVTVQVLGGLWGLVVLPVGAGASLVNFGLAASLAMAALPPASARWRQPAPPPASLRGRQAGSPTPERRERRMVAVVCLIAALLLLVLGDIHGGAATIGALLAALLVRGGPSRNPA